MKKVLWLIVCLMTMVLSSCNSLYVATATFEVCYPDGTRTESASQVVSSADEPKVKCFSYGGTNYVSAIYTSEWNKKFDAKDVIASSTAPIRLLDSKVEKTKARDYKGYGKKSGDDIYN